MKIKKIITGTVATAMVITSPLISTSVSEKEYPSFTVYSAQKQEPTIYEYKMDCGYIYYSVENGNAVIESCYFTDKTITEFTVPAEIDGYPVTKLGDEAFAYLNDIEGIVVPEYIEEIGKGAFYSMSENGLKWVRIENENLIIPSDSDPFGYTSTIYGKENSTAQLIAYKLGKYFVDYEKRVEYGDLTGQIVDGTIAIIECDVNAEAVTIPEKINNLPVTAIDRMAFYDCQNLRSVYIPDSVTAINDDAFLCCTQLTDVRLPETLTELPESCFQSCTSLKSIELPDTVKKIGSSAFAGCSSLENINITDRIEYIGTNAFSGTLWIENYSDENNLVIVNGFLQDGKNFTGENLVIPDGVKYISDYAFQSMDNLKTITFPDSLKVIEEDCFSYCTNLTSVSFPDTLEQIGDNAFKGCTNLDDVIFPEALTELGYQSFAECKTLSQIKIPEKITDIDSNCFNNCTNLKKILLPENLKSIGYMSFMNCVNLDRIDIPDSVENIDGSAFGNCIKLENIHLPYSLKKIGDYAFDGCTLLTEIYFPSEKEFEMCSTSFKNTPWLENMRKENTPIIINSMLLDGTQCTGDYVVPDGITYICGNAFDESEITSVSIPDSVQKFGFAAFSGCKNITEFTIPDGVTDIAICMFSGCTSLKKVNIPESVKFIHNGAFDFCHGLTEFTVPEHVESVAMAFDYCGNLKTITFENPECVITPDSPNFSSMPMSTVVRGYADSAAYWFAYITGRKFEEIYKTGDTNSDAVLNIADVVMLQKWLINSDEITSMNAADICKDEKINVFDLTALKRIIRT